MVIDLGSRIAARQILLAPGIHDGLTAVLAEQAGAEALYLSGAAQAYARHGRPDIGLVTMSEVAETIALIRDRVGLPLIVDADNGHGNALNVQRTVRTYERMGANALQIEDQTLPKRCGHLAEKSVIPAAEMLGKLHAALDARHSTRTLVIARTDAIAVEGFEAALERAHSYSLAGADMIFMDALQTEDEMRAAVAALPDVPLMANMVEGGKTPLKSARELEQIGFSLVIFPAGVVRAQAAAARDYYAALMANGTSAGFDRMLDFGGLNGVIGTADLLAAGKHYER